MKYLLALLALFFLTFSLPNAALADGDENDRAGYSSNVYQRAERRDYSEERLRRDYLRWKRDQAAQRALELQEARDDRRAARAREERREARRERSTRETRRERLAREDENRRYERQRRKAKQAQYYDQDYNRESGAACKPRMTGYGTNSSFRLIAESSARASWVTQVTDQYSRRYANVKRAEDRRYVCDPVSATRIACKFIARPCRATEF